MLDLKDVRLSNVHSEGDKSCVTPDKCLSHERKAKPSLPARVPGRLWTTCLQSSPGRRITSDNCKPCLLNIVLT